MVLRSDLLLQHLPLRLHRQRSRGRSLCGKSLCGKSLCDKSHSIRNCLGEISQHHGQWSKSVSLMHSKRREGEIRHGSFQTDQ
jgi:hypothetical protein